LHQNLLRHPEEAYQKRSSIVQSLLATFFSHLVDSLHMHFPMDFLFSTHRDSPCYCVASKITSSLSHILIDHSHAFGNVDGRWTAETCRLCHQVHLKMNIRIIWYFRFSIYVFLCMPGPGFPSRGMCMYSELEMNDVLSVP
jgi:hypothetical protein